MAELDIAATSRTNIGTTADFSVDSKQLDQAGIQKETYYDYPNSAQYLGYYKTIPELKKAIDALAIWTVGKGLETDIETQVILDHLSGWGEDTYQTIFKNLIIQKKVFGDAFAEIVKQDDVIVNLKPLYAGDMRVVVDTNGVIIRYEQRPPNKNGKIQTFDPEQILHLCNDRVANEIHGVSVIECCKWVIDARNEVLQDHRKVIHRNVVPVRIIEIDTDNVTKRNALISEYEDAIKKGEVLIVPKGTVEIKDNNIQIQDPLAWITYLENFFYQAVGVPRVIASSQDYSEASSKVGYLTFEPIYTSEQTEFEADIWNKLFLRIKFNRPPSLGSFMANSEAKNTGQTGFQPNDMMTTMSRTE